MKWENKEQEETGEQEKEKGESKDGRVMRTEAGVGAVIVEIRAGTKVERWKLGEVMIGWKERRKRNEGEENSVNESS